MEESLGPLGAVLNVDRLASFLLVVVIASLYVRDLRIGLALFAVQSIALTLISVTLALTGDEPLIWLSVLFTIVVKVILIPQRLYDALRHAERKIEVGTVATDRLIVLAGIGLAAISYRVVEPLGAFGASASLQSLPVSIAVMLIGLFTMLVRRKVVSQALGLVTLENGIYLAALVSTHGLPIAVELAILLDLFVTAFVLGNFAKRIAVLHDGRIDSTIMMRLRDYQPRRFRR